MGSRRKRIVVMLAVGLLALAACATRTCIVCGGDVAGTGIDVSYRGSAYAVCSEGCLSTWQQSAAAGGLDAIVRHVEPRGALFQADTRFLNAEFQARRPLAAVWPFAGLWVLVAVLSGGMAAGYACLTHRRPSAAFAVGFLVPGFGALAALGLPRVSGEFDPRGAKIPRTHAQRACSACGRGCHPAATRCAACGAALAPLTASEVDKVRTQRDGS